MENLIDGKYGEMCECGVLVTQESMTDYDVSKVDADEKSDSPDVSNSSNSSKIGTPNIDENIVIGKSCIV